MAVILHADSGLRLYFHANDEPQLYRRELRWCDAYGVVNLDPDGLAELPTRAAEKVVVLGPTFAVRAWPRHRAVATAARALPRAVAAGLPRPAWRRYVGSFRSQATSRLPMSAYAPGTADPRYVFFAATWWPYGADAELNQSRQAFVTACQDRRNLAFEGGFVNTKGPPDASGAGYPVLARRYSTEDYLARTKRAAVVFNCPAVHGCHGWKLGEYLAVGKAIISLPPRRALPAPLIHGKHLHLVEGMEHLDEALEHLLVDRGYADSLALEARRYWEDHLAPTKVVLRMVDRALANVANRDPLTNRPPPVA
jgi:hypothetical protein